MGPAITPQSCWYTFTPTLRHAPSRSTARPRAPTLPPPDPSVMHGAAVAARAGPVRAVRVARPVGEAACIAVPTPRLRGLLLVLPCAPAAARPQLLLLLLLEHEGRPGRGCSCRPAAGARTQPGGGARVAQQLLLCLCHPLLVKPVGPHEGACVWCGSMHGRGGKGRGEGERGSGGPCCAHPPPARTPIPNKAQQPSWHAPVRLLLGHVLQDLIRVLTARGVADAGQGALLLMRCGGARGMSSCALQHSSRSRSGGERGAGHLLKSCPGELSGSAARHWQAAHGSHHQRVLLLLGTSPHILLRPQPGNRTSHHSTHPVANAARQPDLPLARAAVIVGGVRLAHLRGRVQCRDTALSCTWGKKELPPGAPLLRQRSALHPREQWCPPLTRTLTPPGPWRLVLVAW